LNTQYADYSFDGIDIVCVKTGRQRYFGETFLAGMERVEGDHFLSMMIDFFLEGRVDVECMNRLYNSFLEDGVDSLVLEDPPISDSKPIPGCPECHEMNYPVREYGFGFSAGFRKKSFMRKMIAKWENPWFCEYFGSRRANLIRPKSWFYHAQKVPVFPFHPAGVLHGNGRWFKPAVERIDWTGVPLDFNSSPRSWYVPSRWPRLSRIPVELRLLPLRLKSMKSLYMLKRGRLVNDEPHT